MCKVPGEDKGLETRQDWGLESRDHWCCMERAMMEVMPALAGIAVVVVVGVCGGAGRGEGEEKSLACEGEGDEAAEGDRALPTSSASAAAAAAAATTTTGCLPLPRCVLEPLCDLDRNKRRLGFLWGDVPVPAGGEAPSDDEVEDDDDDEEADEEEEDGGREGAVEGVVPNPSMDRTRCIVLCGLVFSPRASTTKARGPSDWIVGDDRGRKGC